MICVVFIYMNILSTSPPPSLIFWKMVICMDIYNANTWVFMWLFHMKLCVYIWATSCMAGYLWWNFYRCGEAVNAWTTRINTGTLEYNTKACDLYSLAHSLLQHSNWHRLPFILLNKQENRRSTATIIKPKIKLNKQK